jgi:hypothetical protein
LLCLFYISACDSSPTDPPKLSATEKRACDELNAKLDAEDTQIRAMKPLVNMREAEPVLLKYIEDGHLVSEVSHISKGLTIPITYINIYPKEIYVNQLLHIIITDFPDVRKVLLNTREGSNKQAVQYTIKGTLGAFCGSSNVENDEILNKLNRPIKNKNYKGGGWESLETEYIEQALNIGRCKISAENYKNITLSAK